MAAIPPADPMRSATAIVIPCYNEAARLDLDALRRFAAERDWLRWVLVDDGSRDDTRGLLETLAREDPARFQCLGLDQNQGKAEATRLGVLQALERSPAFVGFWDADLATPLDEIDAFLAAFTRHPELEIVMGSRVQLLGHDIQRSAARHYVGRIAATAASALVLHIPVYDTQCGAKLFRVTDDLAAVFSEPFVTRWVFDVEILVRWLSRNPHPERREVGRFIREIPVETWHDVAGSRLQSGDFLRAPLDLWRIHRHYRKRA